jgi:antitoxin YefM
LDDVCDSHTPTIITRQRGSHAVLISLEDYNSMEETLYLLRSPVNANRLMESIAQLKAGKAKPRGLLSNEPEDQEQD